jgi:TRAP-type C4-dicarboxylate transport system permease small subunit
VEALRKLIGHLAALCALAGGAMLLLLVAVTCASIVGRSFAFLGAGPLPGDFELVEIGVAFAVFSFLPWCQHRDGHARVELLKRFFGESANWILDILARALMLGIAAVIAWRLYHGMVDKLAYRETTFILRLPLGWGYAAALPSACVFVLVSASGLLETLLSRRQTARKLGSP